MSLPDWIFVCLSPCMYGTRKCLGRHDVTRSHSGHGRGQREGRGTERTLFYLLLHSYILNRWAEVLKFTTLSK